MANLITIARLMLLFVTIWLIYEGNVQVITACIFVLLFIFISDGLLTAGLPDAVARLQISAQYSTSPAIASSKMLSGWSSRRWG